jgi:ribosomal protein S27AE
VLKVMRCLDEELRKSPAPEVKAYKVIRLLLEASIAALEKGNQEPQTFDRATLLAILDPKQAAAGRDPARWLPTTALEAFLDARMNSIRLRAEQMGLKHLPVIESNDGKGGAGNQRIYWLATRPVETIDGGTQAGREHRQIVYIRTDDGEVQPALFLRLIFRKGVLENRSWRGLMMFIIVVLGMGSLLRWVLASIWSLSTIDQALTLRQLASSVLVVFLAWLIWRGVHQPWVELVDNRVVKAPASLLALKEDSAELEMYRDDAKRPWTRFVRFSSECPLCGGQVLLAQGKPDHLMPLVGRCGESPHAHVFSFDRARLSGDYIGPSLG